MDLSQIYIGFQTALQPINLLFCLIGVYSVTGNAWDIVVMLVFAMVGYLMKKFDYEPAPLVLAFVLGRMAEESVRQSLVLSRGDLLVFFRHPISCASIIIACILIFYPLIRHLLKKTLSSARGAEA